MPPNDQLSRRAFLTRFGLMGTAAVVAACTPGAAPSPTAAPGKVVPTAVPDKPAAKAEQPAPGPAAKAEIGPPEVTKLKSTQAVVSLAFLPIYVARHKGFFKEEGLEVEQLATAGGGPDLQALIAGDAQFNTGAGTYQTDAFKQGKPVTNVYNYLNKNIVNVAMHKDVAKERGITEKSPLKDKLAALKGLKFGATRPGALTFQQAEYHVRSAGLEPQKDVQVVGAGSGAALIAALETRQVDVICQTIPVMEQAVARGNAIMLINNSAGEDPGLVPFNMENVFVTPEFAEKNPNTVARFVRAVHKANQWILQNKGEAIAEAIRPDFEKTDFEVLVAGAENTKNATNPTGILERKALENQLKMQNITNLDVDKVYGLFTDKYIKMISG